jgi:hypothetical protein
MLADAVQTCKHEVTRELGVLKLGNMGAVRLKELRGDAEVDQVDCLRII